MGKIKGWRKIYGKDIESSNGLTYRNDTANKIINRASLLTIQPSYDYSMYAVFFENQLNNKFWKKEFKTKKEALDYAMKYMRSHPNGKNKQ